MTQGLPMTQDQIRAFMQAMLLEMLPRPVSLEPGWNLIGATEAEPIEVQDYFPDTLGVAAVYGYAEGSWTYAVRTADGWQGDLTHIEPGRGYWVAMG